MSSTTSSSVGEDTPKQSKPRGSNALACTSTNRVFFLLNLSFTAVLALFFFKLQHGRVSQLFTSVPMSTLSSRLRPAVETLAGADAPAGARKGHVWHLVRQYTYCLAAEAPEPGTFHIKEKTRVRLKRCDPNDSLQHWWYNPKTFQIQAKKRNAHKKRLCLDLYLDGSGFKGNVQLFRCKLSDNQQWEIRQTPVKAHGQIVSKKRGKNKNLICLTTRSKTALGEAAWKSYFSNMPQMFKDHYKSTLGDYVAARICSKEYRFFYTRMQRWRMPKLAITMGSGTKQAHVHSRVPTHDGISVILTVTSLDAGAAMEEHVRDMYPGIQVIILVGTAFDATMAANTESKVISIQRVLENPAHLEEMLETPYVLLMTTSNRLKPDFDLYTLVETLESDPTSLAATGFAVGKDNTLFRPCYTAVQVPVSELRAFESDRAKRFAKLSKRTELEASKEDLVHLAEYRRSAMRRSGSKGVNSDKDMKAAASNAEDPINALDELPLGINDDRRRRRLSSEGNSAVKQWVEGFFQLNAETSAMACDRGAKPALVRTKDVITFIQQDLGDTSGTHSGAANWSPNELVSGIAVTSNGQTVMRRIAVNPAFLSDTTAFKCSLQPTKFAPKRDCFLPPDNMEAPIPLEDIWATNSTCRKVLGTDERRDQLRGLSEALDVFGRSIHQTNFYYMDGSLLGLIKLGTFAPWDTDGKLTTYVLFLGFAAH